MEHLKEPMTFDGPSYNPALDQVRLTGQIKRVFTCMVDGKWRTLQEIHDETRDPEASISAQLRHLRKIKFGRHHVPKRRRGDEECGLWEYKLVANVPHVQQSLF